MLLADDAYEADPLQYGVDNMIEDAPVDAEEAGASLDVPDFEDNVEEVRTWCGPGNLGVSQGNSFEAVTMPAIVHYLAAYMCASSFLSSG